MCLCYSHWKVSKQDLESRGEINNLADSKLPYKVTRLFDRSHRLPIRKNREIHFVRFNLYLLSSLSVDILLGVKIHSFFSFEFFDCITTILNKI